MNDRYRRWLIDLTALPTAPGCEHRVINWVLRWARRRPSVQVRTDRFGNLLLTRKTPRSKTQPIYFTAHMDHPAFVVTKALDSRTIEASFRGGVQERFFIGSRVILHHGRSCVQRGTVQHLKTTHAKNNDRRVIVQFRRKLPTLVTGCVMTWDTGPARIQKQRLFAPACDDLAGVAAALSAFDALGRHGGQVGVLLTRAEEIGFIGAIGACTSKIIPSDTRLIALECSKSFSDSPLGGGPIVRVGDRTSTFDPDLTQRLDRIAQRIASNDSTFRFQRCLMPGGTCEATAYQAYGYTAACLCLPLTHYHNMNTDNNTIDSEWISLADYDRLIQLLIATGKHLDLVAVKNSLRSRLDQLFADRHALLTN